MNIISAEFITGAVRPDQYPPHRLPEFAFYGKSNTGKSSLINFITGRHNLVKTSATPGLTKQINFFLVNQSFCLTDLPGVGYSKLPGAVRKALLPMIETYCRSRDNLKGIFYLLDLRREVGSAELETYAALGQGRIPVTIVGTKADKLGSNQLHKTVHAWAKAFGIPPEELLVTSVLDKTGRDRLLRHLSAMLSRS